MSFNAIRENKILAKIYESTVQLLHILILFQKLACQWVKMSLSGTKHGK